ncbi:MAG: hypothetical protein M1490_00410 [Candidatus Bathyarchaeota archaeon]|nr:hypothetical protein [Candidatus Bathyarchaeota archaeon]
MKTQNSYISSQQMRALEVNAEYFGVSLLQLMELAGRNVAQEAIKRFPKGGKVAIFCGLGGNGGDGFVAARHLLAAGFEVFIVRPIYQVVSWKDKPIHLRIQKHPPTHFFASILFWNFKKAKTLPKSAYLFEIVRSLYNHAGSKCVGGLTCFSLVADGFDLRFVGVLFWFDRFHKQVCHTS